MENAETQKAEAPMVDLLDPGSLIEKPMAGKTIVIDKRQSPHSPISKIELLTCAVFFLSVVGYGLYDLYDTATDLSTYFRLRKYSHLEPGRFIKHHFRDFADIEWNAFENHWLDFLVCGLLNAAINRALSYLKVDWLRRWSVPVVGLISMVVACGAYNTAILVAENVLVYATMRISRQPLIFGWLVGAVHIIAPMPAFIGDSQFFRGNDFAAVFSMWCWMWNVMRFVSFGSEWQWENDNTQRIALKDVGEPSDHISTADVTSGSKSDKAKAEETKLKNRGRDFGLLSFLGYFLYTPTIFGPIVTYRRYHDQAIEPASQPESRDEKLFTARKFFRQLALVAVWLLVCLVWNELFMLHALEQQPNVLQSLNGFGIGVISWCHGQYFQTKYMMLYGLPWLLAFIDQVELTTLPIWVSRVYLFSDMWKYLDTGLYAFLKSYIYIPVTREHGRNIGGVATFFFIWAWHGTNKTIGLWTVCNFVQIAIEGIMRQASNDPKSLLFKYVRSRVSPSCWRRLEALACGVSFTFSCFANTYFVLGYKAASIIAPRTYWPGNINVWMYIITSYAWVQTVFSYENWITNKHL